VQGSALVGPPSTVLLGGQCSAPVPRTATAPPTERGSIGPLRAEARRKGP